jgi:hypothetical protein
MNEGRKRLSPKPGGESLWSERDLAIEALDRMMEVDGRHTRAGTKRLPADGKPEEEPA